jgi:hypothetical protein
MSDTLTLPNQPVTISDHGAQITKELNFNEWREQVEFFQKAKDHYLNNLSSLFRYGNKKFGAKKVATVLDQLEFNLNDANKALAIATLDEEFKQTHGLTAEHYFILSSLETEEEREKWAKLSQENNLSALELKKSIANGAVITQQEIEDKLGSGSSILTIQGISFQFNQWQKKNGGEEKLLELSQEKRKRLLEQMEPMLDLAIKITESLDDDKPADA